MWLEADGGILEITKLLLPEKAKNFMFFTDKTKPVTAKHPRDKTYTIDKEGIDKVIKMDCTSFLIFACDANPMINSDQWFLRKSKHQERITLGLQTQGEIKTIELSTAQLDELLSGALLPEVGCQLELSKMAVPQEALDCLFQLQRPFPRIFKFVDADDNIHPALHSLLMR